MSRIAYANFPTQYADALRNKGQRPKARAFWEYHYDMEKGERNSVRFYAQSWGVPKSTAADWITNFKEQIDLYHAAWHFKNKSHYSYTKNHPDTSDSKSRTLRTAVHTMSAEFQNILPDTSDSKSRTKLLIQIKKKMYALHTSGMTGCLMICFSFMRRTPGTLAAKRRHTMRT